MSKIQVIALTILVLILSINSIINFEKNNVKADTVVKLSFITEDTTWTKENSPYYIKDDVTVQKNATLTIEPGVEIKINNNRRLFVYGKINAIGTEENRIIFTTNSTNPTYRSWEGIEFESEEQSIIKYCIIGYSNYGINAQYSSNLTIENNLISNNVVGIFLLHSSKIEINGNNIFFTVSDAFYTNQVSLINFTNNNIYVNNGRGLLLFKNYYSNFENNTIISNFYGLRLGSSRNNTIHHNLIENNRQGIEIVNSHDNIIYSNNIINNSKQTLVENIYYYDNEMFNNYWDDYFGNDTNDNGVWDDPYIIGEYLQDNFPKTTPIQDLGSKTPFNISFITYTISKDKDMISPFDIINITIIVNHGLLDGKGIDINISSNVNGFFSPIEDYLNGTYFVSFTAPGREELPDSFDINVTISKKGFHYGSELINIEVIQEPTDTDDDNILFQYFFTIFMAFLIIFIIFAIVMFRRKSLNSKK